MCEDGGKIIKNDDGEMVRVNHARLVLRKRDPINLDSDPGEWFMSWLDDDPIHPPTSE